MIYTLEEIEKVWSSISCYGMTWKKDSGKMIDFFWETKNEDEPKKSYLNNSAANYINLKFRAQTTIPHDSSPVKKQMLISDHNKTKKSFYNLIKVLFREKSNILEDVKMIEAIWQIALQRSSWNTNITYWKSKSKNSEKDLISFLIYLFDQYKDIPLFLHKEWYRSQGNPPEIYFHLSRGESIKSFNGFPIDMTRKMKNTFLKAPNEYTYKEAVLWTDIITLGGTSKLANNLFNTPIFGQMANVNRYEFWRSVIRFLSEAPMFDFVHAGPIIDYINSQKFVNDATGNPLHPNMSMQGRDIAGLLKSTEEWHEELNRQNKEVRKYAGARKIPSSWKGFGVKPFEVTKKEPVRWAIKEITTAVDLATEGREMRHCVGSYAWNCSSGKLAIFSFTKIDKSGISKRVVTIELSSKGVIEQARGKANKKPEKDESVFIKTWASERGYEVSKWSGL